MDKVLFAGAGSHNHYRVMERRYNNRPSRLLLSGRAAPQSGLALDEDPELLFDYNQRFLEIALSLDPQSILVIGGGAFTLPKALVERFPMAKIDAVEIDSLLPGLAKDYFYLPDSPNLSITTEDGRTYIETCQRLYDLIVVDAFDEFEIPPRLMSAQAAQHYSRLLVPGGVLTFNLISHYHGKRHTLAHRLLATFRSSFALTELYPADPHFDRLDEQNLLFVASDAAELHLDYLQSSAVEQHVFNDDHLHILDSH